MTRTGRFLCKLAILAGCLAPFAGVYINVSTEGFGDAGPKLDLDEYLWRKRLAVLVAIGGALAGVAAAVCLYWLDRRQRMQS